MPFGPFALQWRAPTPNPPLPTPLPNGITRTFIPTPSGPLELLSALPSKPTTKPPLFFAHGGFGCAALWHHYMSYFSARGYACYALSYRGHGGSWYPGFLGMYFTTRGAIAGDLMCGIQEVERLEQERRKVDEKVRVVLIAHSAGAALGQYVLSKGMVNVSGFCILAGVPGFGSWSCYTHFITTAPLNFFYRFFHSKYILATTQQVKNAFFSEDTSMSVVRSLECLLAPYESMCWPIQALPAFVTGPGVVRRITGWRPRETRTDGPCGIAPRLLVLAAEHDVLCTPGLLEDTARRYRKAFHQCVLAGKLDGVSEDNVREETSDDEGEDRDGVAFVVVKGLGHHLQNHDQWERGAEALFKWTEKL